MNPGDLSFGASSDFRSDFETIKSIFDRAHVGYKIYQDNSLELEAGAENITGYAGFVAFLNFDDKGTLVDINVSE